MFHVIHDGETAGSAGGRRGVDPFWQGFLLGILVGEGHFGGDGRQPQVTVRMHTRHERALRVLQEIVPGSRLYGPYDHGGRHYFQWMARGDVLRHLLFPILRDRLGELDDHARDRFLAMTERYRLA